MNTDLLNTVKKITADYGESVLSDPKRLNGFLADMARDVPKPQKTALIKCLEHGFVQTLKDAPEPARAACKQRLAQKLHEEEGLDMGLCEGTVELLAKVVFGEEEEKIFCNCGKELQEGWKACPYCGTAMPGPSSGAIGSAISSGSGVSGYGVEKIDPKPKPKPKPAKKPPATAPKPKPAPAPTYTPPPPKPEPQKKGSAFWDFVKVVIGIIAIIFFIQSC